MLQTAEEWLDEEADVDDALGAVDAAAGDADDDSGRRAGILRAIAREIATLRRDVALWSAAATAKEQELQRLRVEADA